MAKVQGSGRGVEADEFADEFEAIGDDAAGPADGLRHALELEVDPDTRRALEAELADVLNLETRFDGAGHFIVEGERAESWEDAQRFAARALDAHERLRAHLRAGRAGMRSGAPLFAGMWLADVREMARGAVLVAVHGRMPGVKSSSPLFRIGRKLAMRRHRESGRFDGATRARLACLMATVNQATAARQIAEAIGADEDPHSLVSVLREPERAARALAGMGDVNAARVADILGAMVGLLLGGGDDPLRGIVIPTDARPEDHATARVEEIAAEVARMEGADTRARAGAAFLLGALAFGFGGGHPRPWTSPPTFEARVAEAWERSEEDDEDGGVINGREPVLRWRKSVNAGLYALGHDADKLTKTARENARARAKASRAAGRG